MEPCRKSFSGRGQIPTTRLPGFGGLPWGSVNPEERDRIVGDPILFLLVTAPIFIWGATPLHHFQSILSSTVDAPPTPGHMISRGQTACSSPVQGIPRDWFPRHLPSRPLTLNPRHSEFCRGRKSLSTETANLEGLHLTRGPLTRTASLRVKTTERSRPHLKKSCEPQVSLCTLGLFTHPSQ